MIMKQKKKIETERKTTDDKIVFRRTLLPELLFGILTIVMISGVCYLKNQEQDKTLQYLVFAVLGLGCFGYRLRREYIEELISYENRKHINRFWIVFAMCWIVAGACVFLPVEGWPYVAVFVALALYSTPMTGIFAATVLLMITVMLTGGGAATFFLYFISGLTAVGLFCPLGKEVKIGIPMFLSLLCLFTCETAGFVLTANAHPGVELFLVPVVNLVITAVLLLGMIKLYSGQVVYLYRERYLEINDTENPELAQYREQQKEEYMKCIHIAYFCERIALKLSMDVDALKCAGYYHVKVAEKPELMDEMDFPPAARGILEEYLLLRKNSKKMSVKQKGTAVLLCSETVVVTILQLLSKEQGKALDYEKIIDTIFKHFMDKGTFDICDITLKELRAMQKIFKEEKLYYDFLR